MLKRLIKYVLRYKYYVAGSIICSLFSVALMLYLPVLIGNAVDFIIGANNVNFESIFFILIKMGVVISGAAMFQWLMNFCTNKAAHNTVRDLRKDIYSKINLLPVKFIDTHSHGDIISRVINDADQISEGLLQGLTQLFTGAITIAGTFIFMFTLNKVITLIVLVITPLSLFTAYFISKYSYRMFIKQQEIQGELTGHIEEFLGNQKLVKTFNYEEHAIEGFKEINLRLYKYGQKAQFYSSLSNPSTRFVNGVVYAAVAVAGALYAASSGASVFTVGKIASFLSYANQYAKPFNEITAVITQIQSAFAAAGRIFEIIDQNTEYQDELYKIGDMTEEFLKNKDSYRVDVKDVYFSYEQNRPVIKNVSLMVGAGEKIALVGRTGCGKTTFVNLLMRFYEVDSGSIEINGIDIKNINKNVLRSVFGMVLQDTWLFTGTVKENIAYAKPDASEEEIIEAAKASEADYFISRLPEGYDTVISENAGNISEGQKQLLCIARVMLKRPSILILDEATSNIDTRTEIYVQKAFDKIMEGRTCFVVAHRLSTVRDADYVMNLSQT